MQLLKNQDLFKIRFLASPTYSPGGSRAAFALSSISEADDDYKTDLYLYEDGSTRQLTSCGSAGQFLFEDESTVLFTSGRDKALTERQKAGEKLTPFYRIDVRGGEAVSAFTVPLAVQDIKPLGGGRYAIIADYAAGDPDFSALKDEARDKYIEKKKKEKDYEVLEEIPFWSNGGGFTSRRRSRLYIYDPGTGVAVPVTDELTSVECVWVSGDSVLYTANRFDCKYVLASGVYEYDTLSGTIRTLLDSGRYMIDYLCELGGAPVIIATDGVNGLYDFPLNPSIYTVKNGEAALLLDCDEEAGGAPASDCCYGGGMTRLVRDGSLYYVCAHHTGSRLRRVDPDGQTEVLLDLPGAIDSFDIFNGALLYVGMTGSTAQELYAGLEQKKVTDFNGHMNHEYSIQTPVTLNVKCDWGEMEGFYLEPVGRQPGKRYPAILDIHGGPKVAYGNAFFHEMQAWANAGYYVFYCNPRGGDGRGAEFADILSKYGTIDYDDLMRFTDAMLNVCPAVDPDRLGVTGGSYGGFMTNWIIGHTDRFKAAVSQRSISNWISKFNTTDIGYFFNAMQHRSTPWDNVEKLWWHSPVKYADKAKTPTLFIHSDEDYRCYMAEGLQMFTALRYHGTDARLCLFHGENHELSRSGKPSHRLRRLNEMLAWFDKYLKD